MQISRVALVVEDDPDLKDAVVAYLRGAGFRVVAAADARSAMRQLATALPDVIYLDLGLPDESGYELCERVRQHPGLETVPVVLASERRFPEDMARAEEAGANAFLKKPFSMSQLDSCFDILLGDAQSKKSRPWARRLR